jgi:hypothetical protein
MQEQVTLVAGMVVLRDGLYRVQHQCERGTGESYMFYGVTLPCCPGCNVTYVLVRAVELDSPPPRAATP